jgi:hypothetical protein
MSSSTVKPALVKAADGSDVTSTTQTCQEFNAYFTSVFTREITDNLPYPHQYFLDAKDERLTTFTVTTEMVSKALQKLRIDKPPGPDGLDPRLLVNISANLVKPLSLIYNGTIEDGIVPADWKRANVTPIHKSGDRTNVGNYRPISLTSQLCKLFESIVRDHVTAHLDKLELLNESQHGFRQGRSCLSNLLTFLEKATQAMDEGLGIDVIYLDLAKAFDKVPHSRLLLKLQSHGIDGKILTWL